MLAGPLPSQLRPPRGACTARRDTHSVVAPGDGDNVLSVRRERVHSDGGIRTHTDWLLRPGPLPLGLRRCGVHVLDYEASGARTRNLPLDRRTLYPIEPWPQCVIRRRHDRRRIAFVPGVAFADARAPRVGRPTADHVLHGCYVLLFPDHHLSNSGCVGAKTNRPAWRVQRRRGEWLPGVRSACPSRGPLRVSRLH
jgi:hypothetical protein